MIPRKNHHLQRRVIGRNIVTVNQYSRASTGQGGNAFAINASDVGVVRTDLRPPQ